MKFKFSIFLSVLLYTASAQEIFGSDKPDSLRVLVWNLWHGGNEVDNGPEKALQLIKDSDADICLLQESHDIKGPRPKFGLWAAKELGWNVWMGNSSHLCVLTRFKIKQQFLQSKKHGVGVALEDNQGRTIHAFSVWIDSKDYAPYLLRDNPDCTDADLIACENKRLRQSAALLDYLKENELTSLQTPLLVGGDWNSPSHLDWTEAAGEAFPNRRAIAYPVSKGMEDVGFSDVYRVIHSDPVTYLGNTWSPLKVEQPQDRIDRLYYRANSETPALTPVRATLYPEVLEDENLPVSERLFPSDHAALLFEFAWNDKTAP